MKKEISKVLHASFKDHCVSISDWYTNSKGFGDTLVVKDLKTNKYLRIIYYKDKSGLFILTTNYSGKSQEARCFNNTLFDWLKEYILQCKLVFTKIEELPYQPQQLMIDFDSGEIVNQEVKVFTKRRK